MKVVGALNQALHTCLAEDERVHFLGEDVLDPYGGAFKLAEGLSTAFPDRVHTTPVSEAGIVGAGVGMALRGLLPVVEIMFGDFITLAADQMINHAAKFRWISNNQTRVPLVVRTPMGGGRGYGPTHSQTLERIFLGVPGLRVVAPNALIDCGQALQQAVLRDPDPVLFVEHKLLYGVEQRAWSSLDEFEGEAIPNAYPAIRLRTAGAPSPTCTVTAYGYMVELALEAMTELAYQHELFVDLVVYQQLAPFEFEPLQASLAATGRLVTLEEGVRTHGWGAEVVAEAVERADRPIEIRRVAAMDLPVPAAGPLEEAVLPSAQSIVRAVRDLHGR